MAKPKVTNLMKGAQARNLIYELGGSGRVAEILECKSPSVSAWIHKGVPNARLMYLRTAFPDLKAWKHLKG